MLADAITAIALFIGLSIVRFGTGAWESTWASAGIDARLAAFLYGLALVAVLWVQGLYRLRVRWSRRREALDVLFAVLLVAVVVFTALFLFKLPNVSRLFLILLFPAQALLTIASRALIRLIFVNLRANAHGTRYMLIVGANPAGEVLRRPAGDATWSSASSLIGLPRRTRRIARERATRRRTRAAGPRRPPRHREAILHGTVVDEVAICLPAADIALVEPIARLCEEEGRIVRIPLGEVAFSLPGGRVEELDGQPILSLVHGPDRALGTLASKRAASTSRWRWPLRWSS